VSERDVHSRLQKLSQMDGPPRSLRGVIGDRQSAASEEEIQVRIREESQKLLKQAENLLAQREAQLVARERSLAAHEAGIDLSAINAETIARVGELETQLAEHEQRVTELLEVVEAERARAAELEHMLGYAGGYGAQDDGVADDLKAELEALQSQVNERETSLQELREGAAGAE